MATPFDIRKDQRRRRRRARLSQKDLAVELDVSLTSISQYENGAELPFELTSEDYEAALQTLIARKGK